MDTETSNLQSLTARVERLEKQNRLLKRGGLTLLLSASALVVMGQARPSQSVEAQTFVLRDANGNKRAALGVVNDSPMLEFLDSNGIVKVRVSNGGLGFYGAATGGMNLNAEGLFLIGKQKGLLSLQNSESGMGLSIYDPQGGSASLYSRQDGGTLLDLLDSKGFHTTIGSADLVTPSTGETHKSSAASIRMFNDKATVIWAAP